MSIDNESLRLALSELGNAIQAIDDDQKNDSSFTDEECAIEISASAARAALELIKIHLSITEGKTASTTIDEVKTSILRETNKRLNRRVQTLESSAAYESRIDRLENKLNLYRQNWLSEFDRRGAQHDSWKKVYQLCAPHLDLPCDCFHSVMDFHQVDPEFPFRLDPGEQGRVYANVYLSRQGGIRSFDIVGVVEALVQKLEKSPHAKANQ